LQRRRISIGLAVFAAAAVVGFALARPLAPASLHREIEARLAETLGSTVSIGDLRLSFGWGVLLEATDITAWPAQGGPGLQVTRAVAELRPFAHLTGQNRIRELRLERPVLRVTHRPGDAATPEPLAAFFEILSGQPLATDETPEAPQSLLANLETFVQNALGDWAIADTLEIADGRITYRDWGNGAERTLDISQLSGQLSRPLLGDTHLAARGRVGAAPDSSGWFEWRAEASPGGPLRITLAVTEIDSAPFLPWLQHLRPHADLHAQLSGAIYLESDQPGHLNAEFDLIAHAPKREASPTGSKTDPVALTGSVQISPEELRIAGGRLTSDDLSVELDATLGRPLGPDAPAELALALRDVTVVDLRRAIGWLPEVRREEAEALLASVREGRLRLLRAGGTTTIRDWQRFLVGRSETFPRNFVIDAELAETTVHVEGDDYLESLTGRLWWTGYRAEFRGLSARLNGHPLPRLDLTVEGLPHFFASDPAARAISAGAPPLEGLRTLWLATRGATREQDSQATTTLELEIDHLHHPMFYWPLEDAVARLESHPAGVRISVERGSWAGVPITGAVEWRLEPTEQVEARFAALPATGSPARPGPRPNWAQGRFRSGAFESERWNQESITGAFALRGSTLALDEVVIALAPWGRAKARGQLDLGQRDTVPVDLRFEITDGDLPTLAAGVGLSRSFTTGTVDATGVLETKLRAGDWSASDLGGHVAVDARHGVLRRNPSPGPAEKTATPADRPREIQFDTLESELRFESGVLRTDELALEGPDLRAFASGSVDLTANPPAVDAEFVVFLFRPVDSLLGWIPVVNILLLGPNDNLVAAHYRLDGPVDDPDATLLPLRSFTSGPGTVVFEGLPALVRRGIGALGTLFERPEPAAPPGPAAPR